MKNKILAVDDEQNLLDSLKRQLRKKFQVETALGPEEGLKAIAAKGPFAVILSDLRMPVMDGIEFLSRASEIAPDSVRIMLTGNADLQNAIQAVNEGNIYRFLTKPCATDILTVVLDQGVEQYRLVTAEKELKAKNQRLIELTWKQNQELKGFNTLLEKKVEERTRELDEKNETLNKVNAELEKSVANTIRLLSSLVESLSPDLGKHMKKVAEISRKIAATMELKPKQIETIEIAAMVHDIGLIGATDKIWRKDETEMPVSELDGYRHHPMIASVCLESVESLVEIREIVMHHHEHFDGGGYPAGLQGHDIPLGSRIIGIVGDYCRVTDSWPDKLAHVKHKAIRLLGTQARDLCFNDIAGYIDKIKELFLLSRAGTYYDPEIVAMISNQRNLIMDTNSSLERNVTVVHYTDIKVGMKLAMAIHTNDGRFVLASGAVINKTLLDGIQRLAAGKAIAETLQILRQQ